MSFVVNNSGFIAIFQREMSAMRKIEMTEVFGYDGMIDPSSGMTTYSYDPSGSYKGMQYFDKYYGSQKEGYVVNSPDYFDKNSFMFTPPYSPYYNPRTGTRNGSSYPIKSFYHWTDITTYIPLVGLIYL